MNEKTTAEKPKTAPTAPKAPPKAPAASVKAAPIVSKDEAKPGDVHAASAPHEVETKTYADGTVATGTAPLPEKSPTAETVTDPVNGLVVKKNPTLAELRAEEAAFMAREKEELRLKKERDKQEAKDRKDAEKTEKAEKKLQDKRDAKEVASTTTAEEREKARAVKLAEKQEERAKKAEEKLKARGEAAEAKLKDAADKRDAKKAERAEEAAKAAEANKSEREAAAQKKKDASEAKQIERFREAAEARRKIAERKKATKFTDGGRRPKATHIKLNVEGFSKTQDFSLRGKVHAFMLTNYKPGDIIAIDELGEKTKSMLYGLNVRSVLNKLDETAHIDFVPLADSPKLVDETPTPA